MANKKPPKEIEEELKRSGKKDAKPVTKEMRENIEQAFEEMGGVEGLIAWAQADERNEMAFYTRLCSRVITEKREVEVEQKSTYEQALSEILDESKKNEKKKKAGKGVKFISAEQAKELH